MRLLLTVTPSHLNNLQFLSDREVRHIIDLAHGQVSRASTKGFS